MSQLVRIIFYVAAFVAITILIWCHKVFCRRGDTSDVSSKLLLKRKLRKRARPVSPSVSREVPSADRSNSCLPLIDPKQQKGLECVLDLSERRKSRRKSENKPECLELSHSRIPSWNVPVHRHRMRLSVYGQESPEVLLLPGLLDFNRQSVISNSNLNHQSGCISENGVNYNANLARNDQERFNDILLPVPASEHFV